MNLIDIKIGEEYFHLCENFYVPYNERFTIEKVKVDGIDSYSNLVWNDMNGTRMYVHPEKLFVTDQEAKTAKDNAENEFLKTIGKSSTSKYYY